MHGIYFDNYRIGQTFQSPSRTITETDIVWFATMSGDMNELHTSEHYAQENQFGTRIAHGLLGLSIVHGLMFRTGLFDGTGIAFLNIANWQFKAPIYIGDSVHAAVSVLEKTASRSKKDRGIVQFTVQLVNQNGQVTQEGVQVIMIKRKPEEQEAGIDE